MYRLIFPVMVLCMNTFPGAAQVRKPVKPAHLKPLPANLGNKDSIPLGRYKYYKIDQSSNSRYLNSSISKDSVRQEKAGKADWDDFAKAYATLQKSFVANQYNNVENYIDTGKDFIELKLLTADFFPNTAKVCLRQLSFNIQLLNQLLAKPLTEKTDVQLLSAVTNNIDVLINKYVATKGTVLSTKILLLPKVSIKVFDHTGTELTNAKCYFISFRTCRDIACRSCVPGLDPCDESNISAITSKPDGVFDCTNPVKINVDYGHYHFFVISNKKIRYYEQLHIDENSVSSGDNNQIKINLQ